MAGVVAAAVAVGIGELAAAAAITLGVLELYPVLLVNGGGGAAGDSAPP